ncbi:peptidoglycan DD-metalloendopeptidase family protein [bacterium]|nr:peptidoglycan DD-metalloendopeptidase family protein [bacterium]
MASERKKWISIMIVPEDGAGVRKWRITNKRFTFFKSLFIVMCVFLLIGFASLAGLGLMYVKLKEYKQYNAQLLEATSKLNVIAASLERYEEKERKLRSIIGSDFQLPVAMNANDMIPDAKASTATAEVGKDEFDQLLKSEEAKMRCRPTIWPIDPWEISKEFVSTGNLRMDHLGIDILASRESNVFATADGEVAFAGVDEILGLCIVINHGENGWITKYGHNELLLVKEGESVRKGQAIAIFGGSDSSGTGPHLHYGMFYKGKPVNPLDYLPEIPRLKKTQS